MGREATAVFSTLFALLILLVLRIPLRKAMKAEVKALKGDSSAAEEGEKNQ